MVLVGISMDTGWDDSQMTKCPIHPKTGKWIKLDNGLWKLKCKKCYEMLGSGLWLNAITVRKK